MATLPDTASPETESQDQDAAEAEHAPAATAAPSRRRFFALGAAAATGALASIASNTSNAQTTKPRGKPLPPPTPLGGRLDASADWKDPVLRLVRRITMGLEPAEVALARSMGYAGYLEYQLNAAGIPDTETDAAIAAKMPLTLQTMAEVKAADGGELYNQLADAAFYRAAFSKRQLKERMVEFWTDHFNILYDKVQFLKVIDDRDVIRQHALGKFPDMLRASAESPAMLLYLDQNSSRKPTPNQNYAREIMELHTLGVDGGYTQNDVAQLSRILTGWGYNSSYVFLFQKAFHDFTAKTFLGTTFPAMPSTATPAQMKAEGDAAIAMLLNHPATARFIAFKMARWLLAYEPPQAVVDATAATYTATGGDIKAMIRTILTGKNLMASPAKYKRPFHLAASSLRAMGADVINIRPVRQRLDTMDMTPFYWEQPDGYPDRISWWSGLVSSRWNWATYLSGRPTNDANVRVDTLGKFRAPLDTADGVVAQINTRMFAGEIPTSLKASLTAYLKAGLFNDARVRETIGLAASSHQFQWY